MIFWELKRKKKLTVLRKTIAIILILWFITHAYSIGQEHVFFDAKKMMRMHQFEEEILQVQRYQGKFNGVIKSSDLRFSEKQFDGMQRISKEVAWIKKESIELASETYYTYFQENTVPSKKEEISYINKFYIETEFNNKNIIAAETIYKLTDDDTIPQKDAPEYFISQASWKYDNLDRIISEEFKNAEGKIEKKEYTYTKKAKTPDMKVYENNFLILTRTYESETKRTDFIYFEDGYCVQALYQDGRKTVETFMYKDEIIRTQVINDEIQAETTPKENEPPQIPQPNSTGSPMPNPAKLPLIEETEDNLFALPPLSKEKQ